jgi:hypothetical protein
MSKRKIYAVFDNGTTRERQSYLLVPEVCTIGDVVDSFNSHHAKELWKVEQVKLVGIVASKDKLNREADIAWAPTSVQLGDMMGPDDYLVLCSCDPPPPPPAATVADDPPYAVAADHAKTPQPGDKKAEAGRTSGPNGKNPHGGRKRNRAHAFPKHNEVRRLQDDLSPSMWQRQRERKKTSFFAPSWQSQMSTMKGSNKQMVSHTDTNATCYRRNEPTNNETSSESDSDSDSAHVLERPPVVHDKKDVLERPPVVHDKKDEGPPVVGDNNNDDERPPVVDDKTDERPPVVGDNNNNNDDDRPPVVGDVFAPREGDNDDERPSLVDDNDDERPPVVVDVFAPCDDDVLPPQDEDNHDDERPPVVGDVLATRDEHSRLRERQVLFMQERVDAYNAYGGELLTLLIGKRDHKRASKNLDLVLFHFGGMVFGVHETSGLVAVTAETVRGGFEQVFDVPVHPGWTCGHCSETFYVATIGRNHELRRQRNGICPDPLDWSEHIDSSSFYFDLQKDFAEIMHHMSTRDDIVGLRPVDALDPTLYPRFGGVHVVDRARVETQNSASLLLRRKGVWSLSPTVVLDMYQGVGDSFLGRHEGRQGPHAVHHHPIQVAAIGTLPWFPSVPFLKPLSCMSEEFRRAASAPADPG